MTRTFSKRLAATLHESKIVGIRAGVRPHRFLGIWVVVVGRRVFVRPWNDKPAGWYRTFLEEPRGALQVGERLVRVCGRRRSDRRLLDAVDAAYREKYHTPGSVKYVRGFATSRRRLTTIELVPR